MTLPDPAELKRRLRTRMRATPVDPTRHNARIRKLIADWLEHHPECLHIAIYHPLPDEPDLLPLIEELPGRIWHFPSISGGEMTFHPVSDLARDLIPGTHGIPEPKPSIPATRPDDLHAFFCPGLAFEAVTGCRLGRGKGYYDRYLARVPESAHRIGITFPERLVAQTFAEPHDIRMHQVIS